MELVPECGTETCVLFLINMYELAGSLAAYTWGRAHPEFFQRMDAAIVKKVLHSTKIPAGLSLRTFATVSQSFWRAHPKDDLRVIIVGAGCGVESEKMMQERPEDLRLAIRNVDILGWVPGGGPGGHVQVLDPREEWLEPSMPRALMVAASISVSRSRLCEIVGIINKMLQALTAGGTGCISEQDEHPCARAPES